MKNFKKIFAMAAVVLSTGVVTATAVAAGPYYNANESQTLVSSGYTTNSKGQFDFNDGAAYFDAADINNLAAAVNDCFTSASNGKKAVADGLTNVGTYFTGEGTNDYTNNATAQQKSVTYNNGSSAISNSENSDFINTDNIPFSTLMDAVSHSQDIPEAVKQTQATNEAGEYLYYEDETASIARDLTKVSTTNTGFPVYYGEVTPANLSAGSAAWVNGELILGTGSDNDAYYDLGSSDIIIDTISTLYSGITESSNESLVCSQGNATNSITKSVQNSGGNFRDVLYGAYADIPLYKYDDTGCLYILKSVQHYMKGNVSSNWPTESNYAGFMHSISLLDGNGTQLGEVSNHVYNATTGTTFNYTDTVSLSAFDYGITTNTVKIKVTTTIKFDMISGNSNIFSQTGNAQNNAYLTVTYLKQP